MRIFTNDRKLTPSWHLLRPSFWLLRKHFWPVMYLSFVPTLVLTVGVYILGDKPMALPAEQARMGYIIASIGLIWTLLLYPAYLFMLTQSIRGKDPSTMESIRKGLPNLGPIVGLSILEFLIIALGLILFVIPGLIAFRAMFLAPYYLVDQQLSPADAIKKSYRETNPVSIYIWGVIGIAIYFALLANLLDDIAVAGPILGLLVIYPFIFGPALRYGEVSKTGKPINKIIPPREDDYDPDLSG